jgi:magnesium transporter
MADGLRIASEQATARVPTARPEQTAAEVREGLSGNGYDCVDDVAVLDAGRLVGIVPIEVLFAAPGDALLSGLMDSDPPVVTPAVDPESVARPTAWWACCSRSTTRT